MKLKSFQRIVSLAVALAMLMMLFPGTALAAITNPSKEATSTQLQSALSMQALSAGPVIDLSSDPTAFAEGGAYFEYVGDYINFAGNVISVLKSGVTLNGTTSLYSGPDQIQPQKDVEIYIPVDASKFKTDGLKVHRLASEGIIASLTLLPIVAFV